MFFFLLEIFQKLYEVLWFVPVLTKQKVTTARKCILQLLLFHSKFSKEFVNLPERILLDIILFFSFSVGGGGVAAGGEGWRE